MVLHELPQVLIASRSQGAMAGGGYGRGEGG